MTEIHVKDEPDGLTPHMLVSKPKGEICAWCYYERDHISYNINGKCDNCGGQTFAEQEELDQEHD